MLDALRRAMNETVGCDEANAALCCGIAKYRVGMTRKRSGRGLTEVVNTRCQGHKVCEQFDTMCDRSHR
jgi:hypothetical protein